MPKTFATFADARYGILNFWLYVHCTVAYNWYKIIFISSGLGCGELIVIVIKTCNALLKINMCDVTNADC